MRTSEKFKDTWREMEWWLSFHKSPVWICATDEGYSLSVIKPSPEELPAGTAANLYGIGNIVIDKVESNRGF